MWGLLCCAAWHLAILIMVHTGKLMRSPTRSPLSRSIMGLRDVSNTFPNNVLFSFGGAVPCCWGRSTFLGFYFLPHWFIFLLVKQIVNVWPPYFLIKLCRGWDAIRDMFCLARHGIAKLLSQSIFKLNKGLNKFAPRHAAARHHSYYTCKSSNFRTILVGLLRIIFLI